MVCTKTVPTPQKSADHPRILSRYIGTYVHWENPWIIRGFFQCRYCLGAYYHQIECYPVYHEKAKQGAGISAMDFF